MSRPTIRAPHILVRRYRAPAIRPQVYRTHRAPFLRHMALWAGGGLVCGLALLGVVTLIAQLHVSDAALERAHAQGMAIGQSMCAGSSR